jgi:hypothetical protein
MEPAGHLLGGRRAAVRVGAVRALAAAARLPEPAGGALAANGKAQLLCRVYSSGGLAVEDGLKGYKRRLEGMAIVADMKWHTAHVL